MNRKLYPTALVLAALAVSVLCPGGDARAAPRRGGGSGARERLDEIAGQTTVTRQAARARAEGCFQAGLKLYEQLDYAKAHEYFERALELNPGHELAKEYVRRTRSLLNVRRDWAAHSLEELTREKQVKIQELLMQIRNTIERGRHYMREAESFHPGDEAMPKDALLSRRLRDLGKAVTQFKRTLEIIKWMPYPVDLHEEEQLARDRLGEAQARQAEIQESLRSYKRRLAIRQAEARREEEVSYLRDRVSKLLRMAENQYNRGRFEECEKICDRILEIDKFNRDASGLLHSARQKRHESTEEVIYEKTKHEWRKQFLDIEEAAIPYSRRIVYPAYWDRILRRVEKAGKITTRREPEWARDVRRKLQRKVSFEFVDTPLTEAISFLQSITKVTMIVDPKALESRGNTPINLRVRDMTLELALDWILKLADLDHALRDNAVFISSRENLRGDVDLRIYDVRDLTEDIPDFPGPELALEVGGTEGMGAAGAGGVLVEMGAAEGETITAESLAEMIRERVRPDEWASELGTSIQERGGRLVVMQRPEVHRLIDKLLESFRAAQKLLVTVEGRFLEIREGFFEEIGIDWGRLPSRGPIISPTPFGNALGSEIITQTLVNDIGAGYIGRPETANVFGETGQMHVIGAVCNYRPGFSPEQTFYGSRTIQAGGVLEQGLNMEIRYLGGDAELAAFIHALKARHTYSELMAPRLTVYNTQRAHMFVATQTSYIADYEISGDMYDPVIRQYLEGVVFDVRPIVSADRRYITLELRPTTAQLEGPPQRIVIRAWQVFDTTPPTFIVMELPVLFPIMSIRKVRTTVTIPDGGIIMLGGMMKDIKFRAQNGVPFLSNLPIVGKLFRWDVLDNERRNLSILVTARLLLFEEEEQKL